MTLIYTKEKILMKSTHPTEVTLVTLIDTNEVTPITLIDTKIVTPAQWRILRSG